jgi:Protein of unknown function (DUF4019)
MSALLFTLLVLTAFGCSAQHPAPAPTAESSTEAAQRVAAAWLPLIDAGRAKESWTAAAAAFRERVSAAQWRESLRSARAPLGAVTKRQLRWAAHTTTLPNAPQGDYVVIQYATDFAGGRAIETVVTARDADGEWRAAGYFIRRTG